MTWPTVMRMVTTLISICKIAEIEGRIDDAIVFYSSALIIDPYDEESLIGRGSCYTVKKDHEKAVADFKKCLIFRLKPGMPR